MKVLIGISVIIFAFFGICKCYINSGHNYQSYQNCHESIGEDSLNYLSSKRPYFYNNSATHNYVPKGCSAVKFWYFGRHGTRNPGYEDIEAMQQILPVLHAQILKAYEQGQGDICPESFARLKSWVPRTDLNVSEESYLTSQGKWELHSISSRYQQRFPKLFPKTFDNQTYFFKYTDSERTKSSAESFAEAIFGADKLNDVYFPKPEKYDPVLKFYSACPKWTEEVNKNPSANIEHDRFIKSTVFNQTLSKVSRRIGLERNLTLDELTIIYTTCAFESAWENSTISPWCVVFDLKDFKVMAYREDLDYFWLDSYGFEINYQQACPPFKDAVTFFEDYIMDPKFDKKKVQAYFSHSGANLKMLARLGLFNDSRFIKSDNFDQMKDFYAWKTSFLDFMASNFALVLYSCTDEDGKDLENQIGLFFEEVPTPFPACDNKAFCSFKRFRENMADIVDNCDLNEICALPKSTFFK